MSGHGWVTPNADGSVARCGGPGLCDACAKERAAKDAAKDDVPIDEWVRTQSPTAMAAFAERKRIVALVRERAAEEREYRAEHPMRASDVVLFDLANELERGE